jgi:hypothetical protein
MSFHPDDPRDRRDDWDRWEERERRDPWEQPGRAASDAPSVAGPATILLVLAAFNLLAGLGGLAWAQYFNKMDIDEFRAMMSDEDPNASEEESSDPTWNEEDRDAFVWTFGGAGAGSLVAAMILVAGGFAMIARKFYGLAMLAAITAFVSPGGCCLLGVVGGVWSVIVLIDPAVKKSFT